MVKTTDEKYVITLFEIARHEEDANYNRFAYFTIAKMYRERYTRFFWTRTISIIILKLLLSTLDKIIAKTNVNVLKIILSLITVILSSLGLLSVNYNKIANHHLVAHKYQTF